MTDNTKLGIVLQPSISVHEDSANDLREMLSLGGSAKDAALKIIALIEQAKVDKSIIDSLLIHDFGNKRTDDYHVSKWLSFWNSGLDLWRIKLWEVPYGSLPYRIVYAYESSRLRFHILGIVPRDFEYDENHFLTKRILKAYRELSLAEYNPPAIRGKRRGHR